MTENLAYQEEVPNSLGEQTDWSNHEAFIVTVAEKSGYNFVDVTGVIQVHQPRGEELVAWREDRDSDNLFGDSIETTAKGARALAAALIRAAEAAEALEAV
jgi:hypothetical protein